MEPIRVDVCEGINDGKADLFRVDFIPLGLTAAGQSITRLARLHFRPILLRIGLTWIVDGTQSLYVVARSTLIGLDLKRSLPESCDGRTTL